MGAEDFVDYAEGATAEEAFRRMKDAKAWEFGHGGYSGTIAEKHSFVMLSARPLPRQEATALAWQLIEDDDERIADKWGPAGCVPVDGGGFLFFGYASS